MQNRDDSVAIIKQARESGFEALILTVDTPVGGIRLRDLRNGLTIPPRIRISTVFAIARKPIWWLNLFTTKKLEFAAFRGWNKSLLELAGTIYSPAISFEDISWLQSAWDGPIIVKGVQSVEEEIHVRSRIHGYRTFSFSHRCRWHHCEGVVQDLTERHANKTVGSFG